MACRSALLGLLLGACALKLAYAKLAGVTSMLINPLSSRGHIAYLTVKANQPAPYIAVLCEGYCVPVSQKWDVTPTFPDAFKITAQVESFNNKTKVRYNATVANVNNVVKMIQATSSTPASQVTWYFDTWGRLLTSDKKFYLTTNMKEGFADIDLGLKLTSVAKPLNISEQWVILPDLQSQDGMEITGMWRSTFDGTRTDPQLCLDSGPKEALVLGANNAPTLKTCDDNALTQKWVAIPPNLEQDEPKSTKYGSEFGFYPSLFRVYSPITNLCVGMTPAYGILDGREAANLLQVNCSSLFAKTTMGYTTRGQMFFRYTTNNGNPFCLGNGAGTATPSDCSLQTYDNRWQFTY